MKKQEFTGTVICSLCLLRQSGKLLLARKMKKLVVGLWNGYGGRQEPGEMIRTTTVRETYEETGHGILVFPSALDRRAVVYFHNQNKDGTPFTIKVHIFEAWHWQGRALETTEMITPTWFWDNDLPWEEMPVGDPYWLIPVLAEKYVVGHIVYGPKQKYLINEPDIRFVDNLAKLEPED